MDRVSSTSNRGFSLTEVLLVVALGSVMAGITIIGFQAALRQLRGDSNLRIVTWQLQVARETAMSQRRDVEMRFMDPNGIALVRQEIPAGTTLLSTVYLEGNATFRLFPGVPDTPDGFGNQNPVEFGAATLLVFTPEGAFVDQTGVAINGSIFFGVPAQTETARAITVFGPTGRVRAYRWDGSVWHR